MRAFKIIKHGNEQADIVATRSNKMALIVRRGGDWSASRAKMFCKYHDFNLLMARAIIADLDNNRAVGFMVSKITASLRNT